MGNMKAFISYSSQGKEIAREINSFLEMVQIESFVAEDSLRVASDWKDMIVKEVKSCGIFIPLLSKEFKKSSWCSQEIGIAYSLEKKFIPISLDDTRSYGFIDHIQSKAIPPYTKPGLIIAEGLMECKISDGAQGFIKLLTMSGDFRFSERIYKTMEPYFTEFSNGDLNTIVRSSINNSQIWAATKCSREYIPHLLEKRKDDINHDLYEKLNCKIKKNNEE